MIYEISAHGTSYRIEADPESRVGKKLAQGIPYEHHLLEDIRAQNLEGVALDIGAHIGNHALYLAAVCGLEVMAFEPLHSAALVGNVELNPGIRVYPLRVALSDQPGWLLPVGAGRQRAPIGGWGKLELESCAEGTEGAVRARPLDEFEASRVSVVKIDVEGMEAHVIRGAAETIARCKPLIYVEARDAQAHDEVRTALEPLGYRYAYTVKTATPMQRWDPA